MSPIDKIVIECLFAERFRLFELKFHVDGGTTVTVTFETTSAPVNMVFPVSIGKKMI